MSSFLWQPARVAMALVLATVFAVPQNLLVQAHVVSPTELQSAIVDAARTRQRNVEIIRQFLSSPAAEKALKSSRMDPTQVKEGVADLSDEELAQLAARSTKAQTDFAAGTLSQRDLILILIGIAVIILIIVAVR